MKAPLALRFALALALPIVAALAQDPAAPPAPPTEVLRSYGEESPVNVEEAWAAFSEANAGLIGSVNTKSISFADAIKAAHSLSESVGGPAMLATLRAQFPKQDPYTLYTLTAVRETMLGHASTTLVLLVGALDLRPNDADALFNLASVLAGLGYANEALAILDELAKRQLTPNPPLGLSPADATEYLRGYCLVRLGEKAAARQILEPIHPRQPFLAEAPRLLALLDEAEGKDPRKNFLLGVWRHNARLMVCGGVDIEKPEPDPITDGKDIAIDIRSFIDLSKGKRGHLPPLKYAISPEACKNTQEVCQQRAERADTEASTLIEKRTSSTPRGYHHTETSVDEVWGYRMEQLLKSLDYRDAKLRELDRTRLDAAIKAKAAYDKATQECADLSHAAIEAANIARVNAKKPGLTLYEMGQLTRRFYVDAMNQTLGPYQKLERAHRDLFAEWHLLATSLAGRVGDSAWREVFRLHVETQRQFYYSRLLHCADMHASVGYSPLLEAAPGPGPEDTQPQDLGQCDSSKSIGFGINKAGFGEVVPFDLGVELTCEGFSVEASIDVMPLLSLSGEIGIDTKGQYTAFVGPKMDASLRGNGVTMKEGFYVSGNRQGIQDAGAKMETKVNVNQGALTLSQKVSDTSLSFLPGPQTSPPSGLSPISLGR